MADVRIISKADLTGIWADWLYQGTRVERLEVQFGEFAFFGKRFFGEGYFNTVYFTPGWSRTKRMPGNTKVGTLDESDELATAVLLALLTDARADPNEILPDPDSTDRRGWWGDLEAATIWEGWPIGCKNWLMSRAKITNVGSSEGSTLARAEQYTRSALQPFIDKRVCSNITVSAERVELDRIDILVVLYRGPLEDISLRFQNLWSEITRE